MAMQSGAGYELAGLLSQDITPSQAFLNKMCTSDELEQDMDGVLHRFAEQAELLLNKYVTMIVEPDSMSKLGDMLRETQVVKKQLTATVGCIYMSQHAGESDCRPHCRQPRFRADHLKLVVNGLAAASSVSGDEMPKNCHFLIGDAGKDGLDAAISKCFLQSDGKVMVKTKCTSALIFDEEALNKKKARVYGRINLMQRLHVFSHPDAELKYDSTVRTGQRSYVICICICMYVRSRVYYINLKYVLYVISYVDRNRHPCLYRRRVEHAPVLYRRKPPPTARASQWLFCCCQTLIWNYNFKVSLETSA